MSEIAIKVEGLGKRYRIGANQQAYKTLKEKLTATAATPFRAARHLLTRNGNGNSQFAIRNSKSDLIWALKNVSFEIKRGEAVGIIGRNGAGKSTLLKILSRITEPTEGYADIHGRIASLLEVGTGFQPELTGRENIFLNGSILGMKNAEIKKKFDQMVAFAEIEKFIDTPVKHYSSGMYVRLAFAVAAHLDPEILLVDEVLAVGDAAFQKKCLGKMGDVAREGRTVLFVSHNMSAVTRLCDRAILFELGGVVADGKSHHVTGHYLRSGTNSLVERVWPDLETAPGDKVARLRAVRVRNQQAELVETIDIREPVFIEVEYWNLQERLRPTVILHLVNEHGITLFATNDFNNTDWWKTPRKPGVVKAVCRIPDNFLAEGRFFILAAIGTYNPNVVHTLERDVVSFQIIDRSEGDGVRGEYAGGDWPGVVRPILDWNVTTDESFDALTHTQLE